MTDTEIPTILIHGNPYVLVKDRILAFHETHKTGSITTEVTITGNSVLVKATVRPNSDRTFTGHSEAVRGKGGITGQSPVEVAETSAVGRALGMLGIGILESVASADEINKVNQEVPMYVRKGDTIEQSNVPDCAHGKMKLVQVKKEGPNKGRFFYACPAAQGKQCADAFKWADELEPVVTQDEAPAIGDDGLPF